MADPQQIDIPVAYEDEDSSFIEPVTVTPMGDHRYRLEVIPLFLDVGYRDTIEVEPQPDGTLRLKGIAEKSDFTTLRWLLNYKVAESESLKSLLKRVEAEGGCWDQVAGGFLVMALPSTAQIDVDTELAGIAARYE